VLLTLGEMRFSGVGVAMCVSGEAACHPDGGSVETFSARGG